MWTRPLSGPAVTTPLQPCSHVPGLHSHIQAAEPVGPAAGEGLQQTLLLLTEQVSHLVSRVDSLSQAAQTAPAAEELPALQTRMHLKEVVQQELRPLLEQIVHSLTTEMQPARATMPAPAMLEAVQQALSSLEGITAHQQQNAQQQQLVRQLVHLGLTSRASDAALSRQLNSSFSLPAASSGGGCNTQFLAWP